MATKTEERKGGALLSNNVTKPQSKPKRRRDADCCSINFLKCVMHIFNIIYFVSGAAVLTVALWALVWRGTFTSLLPTCTFVLVACTLAIAGAVAAPAAVMACCALKNENRTLMLLYTYILLLTFLAEAGAGGAAYWYEESVDSELQAQLNTTFLFNYNIVTTRTDAINRMQTEFRCCGASSYEEWRNNSWLKGSDEDGNLVPDSCCKTVTEHCGRRDHPSNIHYNGCIRQFTNHIREQLIVLAAVALGVSVIPIFGFIFSCCLYVKVKYVVD